MTLAIAEAESILRARLGEPAKTPTNYIVGFLTPSVKPLAIHREASETRIWFEPPAPPKLDGLRLMDGASSGNSNINGPLLPLRAPTTLRVEVASSGALNRFLDWYIDPEIGHRPLAAAIDPAAFREAFARFQNLVKAESGHPFNGFHEGLVAARENYKPRLRDHAIALLRADEWTEGKIGSGAILERVIDAIEIQDSSLNLTNNLVFWQNIYGHANRDHRELLEARQKPKLRRELESLFFGLYRGDADESMTFDRLRDLIGRKYPLLAYLFFLKDMDRFMPIHPTGFDRAFLALGIYFSTILQCGWTNYSRYNATLAALRPLIEQSAGVKIVRLIDAHTFCWVFSTLLKDEAQGGVARASRSGNDGRVVGGRERSILEMRLAVEDTVKRSNGQIVERVVKNKELRMTPVELEKLIGSLLDLQENRCALTGIPFHFSGPDADKNLLPSLDRKDSSGHYESGNVQLVCRFINFWKGDSDDDEFRRLLKVVRGQEGDN